MTDVASAWYRLSPEEAVEQLDSHPEGLDDDEAGRRATAAQAPAPRSPSW